MVFDQYDRFVKAAENLCIHAPAQPVLAQVYATLALAEATKLTMPFDEIAIKGDLTLEGEIGTELSGEATMNVAGDLTVDTG